MGLAVLNHSLTRLQAPVMPTHRNVQGLLPHETPPSQRGAQARSAVVVNDSPQPIPGPPSPVSPRWGAPACQLQASPAHHLLGHTPPRVYPIPLPSPSLSTTT